MLAIHKVVVIIKMHKCYNLSLGYEQKFIVEPENVQTKAVYKLLSRWSVKLICSLDIASSFSRLVIWV